MARHHSYDDDDDGYEDNHGNDHILSTLLVGGIAAFGGYEFGKSQGQAGQYNPFGAGVAPPSQYRPSPQEFYSRPIVTGPTGIPGTPLYPLNPDPVRLLLGR